MKSPKLDVVSVTIPNTVRHVKFITELEDMEIPFSAEIEVDHDGQESNVVIYTTKEYDEYVATCVEIIQEEWFSGNMLPKLKMLKLKWEESRHGLL